MSSGSASFWARITSTLPHRARIVRSGEVVAQTGTALDTLFFPVGAVFVLVRHNSYDPQPLASGMIGREGIVGWPVLLGASMWQQDAVAIVGGDVIEVPAAAFQAMVAQDPELAALSLRYVHNYTMQLAQNTIANLGHSLERRLARWLTMIHDRSDGDTLVLTHETLASLLNVRRASVTDALHVLEGERLVRCTRGQVAVRDRAALQAAAGYSYGFAEDDYRRAIGPFGRASADQMAEQQPAG